MPVGADASAGRRLGAVLGLLVHAVAVCLGACSICLGIWWPERFVRTATLARAGDLGQGLLIVVAVSTAIAAPIALLATAIHRRMTVAAIGVVHLMVRVVLTLLVGLVVAASPYLQVQDLGSALLMVIGLAVVAEGAFASVSRTPSTEQLTRSSAARARTGA